MAGNRKLHLWLLFLAAWIGIGGAAIIYRVSNGLLVTNLSQFVPWGGWVALYIFFVGLSAGAFLLSSLIYVFGMKQYQKVGRQALFAAFLSMIIALIFIWLDLGRMERFWHGMAFWNILSVLSWEVRFYLLYIVLLVAELYFSMRRDLILLAQESSGWRRTLYSWLTLGSSDTSQQSVERDWRWLKILGIIGIPLAIMGVHGGTGTLFAVVAARPYWNSPLFPIVFVVSALVSGTALLTASYVAQRTARGLEVDVPLVKNLAKLMMFFLAIDLLLEFYEFLVGGYPLRPDKTATLMVLFTGTYAWLFWGIQIGLGALVPIYLVSNKKTNRSIWGLTTAAVLVIIGIIAVRFNLVVPAQIIHQLEGMPPAYYHPNLIEWLSSLGVVALGLLLYTLGIRVLPLDEDEHIGQAFDKGKTARTINSTTGDGGVKEYA